MRRSVPSLVEEQKPSSSLRIVAIAALIEDGSSTTLPWKAKWRGTATNGREPKRMPRVSERATVTVSSDGITHGVPVVGWKLLRSKMRLAVRSCRMRAHSPSAQRKYSVHGNAVTVGGQWGRSPPRLVPSAPAVLCWRRYALKRVASSSS